MHYTLTLTFVHVYNKKKNQSIYNQKVIALYTRQAHSYSDHILIILGGKNMIGIESAFCS